MPACWKGRSSAHQVPHGIMHHIQPQFTFESLDTSHNRIMAPSEHISPFKFTSNQNSHIQWPVPNPHIPRTSQNNVTTQKTNPQTVSTNHIHYRQQSLHKLLGIKNNTTPATNRHLVSHTTNSNIFCVIEASFQSSTLAGYSSAIRHFLSFCTNERIPHQHCFPSSKAILCAFAASHAGKIGGSTTRNKISALKAWHIANNKPWHGSQRLQYVLNGVKALAPPTSHKTP
jgi:hypothetical protein